MTIYRRFIVLHLVSFVLDRWHYDFIHIYKLAQSHTSKHTVLCFVYTQHPPLLQI